MLFINANTGAKGNADTKIVTNPYCRTVKNCFKTKIIVLTTILNKLGKMSYCYQPISRYSGYNAWDPQSTSW